MNKGILLGMFACVICSISAQERLTLSDAITIGLENNYSIKIAKNDNRSAANNVRVGNAGMLPELNATFSNSGATTNVHQTLITGASNDIKGASSTSLTAGVALNWTIFDGFAMFANYSRLKEIQDVGELQFRRTVENSVAQIIAQYYDIISQRETLASLQEAVDVSQKRIDITKSRFDLGAGSEQKNLQATIDYNEDRAAYLRQKAILERSTITLNQLLGRNVNLAVEPADSLSLREKFIQETIRITALKSNTSLAIAQKNKSIADLDLDILNGEWYPRIAVTSGFNYQRTTSQTGFVLSGTTTGLNYGITASVNLFEGWNLQRRIENASIGILSADEIISLTKTQVESDIARAYKSYIAAVELVELETQNRELTKKNISISLERYALGAMNELEIRQAQKSMTDAETRTIRALFDAKILETELLRLSGTLVNP
ncbi:MAG: TolC family protein [Ignavibacteria bacterium]|nr:TolC family protein [Ignavibacteria bacterium]